MNAGDVVTLWLKAPDLPPTGAQAAIERVELRALHPRPGQEEKRLILTFKGKVKKLILNAGNVNRLVRIAGSEDTDSWIGLAVRLKPTTWGDKPTIIIEPATANGK